MDSSLTIATNGPQLVEDFRSVFLSIAMTETAKLEAERSESSFLNELSSVGNTAYLNPANISGNLETDITRASLDTHIKKAQAQQLSLLQQDQLAGLISDDQARYHGKRITVKPLTTSQPPIESVWFDERSGYRTGRVKRAVSGIIEEVLLDKNVLVLKPTLARRLLNRNLKNYLVYVIDPATIQPVVDIQLLS